MSKKFQLVVADCPWSFSDYLSMSDVKRGAAANYQTMTTQQLCDLPVAQIVDPNGALLALWVPSSLLEDGIKVMNAWGFSLRQSYVWNKTKKKPFANFKKWIKKSILKHPQVAYDKFAYDRAVSAIYESMDNIDLSDELSFGMGRLFRQTHEICLIGINNTGIYKQLKNKSQRSVSFATNLKHSAKPEHLQDALDLMFPSADGKIEIFARRQRPGWECVGNEAPATMGQDIKLSLDKLL